MPTFNCRTGLNLHWWLSRQRSPILQLSSNGTQACCQGREGWILSYLIAQAPSQTPSLGRSMSTFVPIRGVQIAIFHAGSVLLIYSASKKSWITVFPTLTSH